MIGVDVAVRDKGQVIRRQVELTRNDVFSELLTGGDIVIERPVVELITEGQFDTLDQSFLVIERGEEDRRTDCPSSIKSLAIL